MEQNGAAAAAVTTTTTTVVTFATFTYGEQKWRTFLDRLEQQFLQNDITDENKKRATLINAFDETTYEVISSLCSPNVPGELTYEELKPICKENFTIPTVTFVERRNFYEAQKDADESCQDFFLRIRKLAMTGDFGDRLEAVLVDKFVINMPTNIFEKLCDEENLTIKRSLEIAKKFEKRNKHDQVNVMKKSNYKKREIQRKQAHTNFKSNQSGEDRKPLSSCQRCGFNNHRSHDCRYKKYKCHSCGKIGHMATVCKFKKINYLQEESEYEEDESTEDGKDEDYKQLYSISARSNGSLKVNIKVFNKILGFQVDSGADISAIPHDVYKRRFSHINLKKYNKIVKGYGGQILKVKGVMFGLINFNNISKEFGFVIIENGEGSVVGKDFFKEFDIKEIKLNSINVSSKNKNSNIPEEFVDLFQNNYGKLKNVKVKLELKDDNCHPVFVKARSIPFAFEKEVEKQLKSLERDGIISKVESTEWGTPLVPIMKENGRIRICADYKVTLNKFLKDTNYPLPIISDLLNKLKNGKYFSKIDLAHAYNQIELDDESKRLATWSTKLGNFQVNRLPFGVKPATGIFQREIEKVFKGQEGVVIFLDDIICFGEDLRIHNARLRSVLQRIGDYGLRLNKNKYLERKESNFVDMKLQTKEYTN